MFTGLEGKRILDLVWRRGWLASLLATHGEATGIDPLEASIERVRELLPEPDFRIGGMQEALPIFGVGLLDLLVLTEVIEHVDHSGKQAFLESIHSFLVAC